MLVNNLHPDVTERVLHTICQPFGPLSVYVCRDTITNRSRGYGCVTFEHRDPENALEALQCSDLMGKPVRIMRGQDMTNKILARGKESSSHGRYAEEIDWTKLIEQSQGKRLANTSTMLSQFNLFNYKQMKTRLHSMGHTVLKAGI